MVSVLDFYSDDPSSNPAEVCKFSDEIIVKRDENKEKSARSWPIFR